MSLEKAIDRCIQCGFCLQACPTYQLFEREESSPRGRIARLKDIALTGAVEATPETLGTFAECLGCRACETACPSGVHYEEILLEGRQRLQAILDPTTPGVRAMLRAIASPGRIASLQRLWRIVGRTLIRLARVLPQRRPEVRLLAALPDPAPQSAPRAPEAEVAIHRGCLMDIFWEGTNARAVLLLREQGITADLLPGSSGCCGALHAHQGDLKTARARAQAVIAAFEASGARTVVSLAGGCGAHLREYPGLFEDDPLWQARAQALSSAVRDVATLLAGAGCPPAPGEGPVTYQDSCHLRNGLRVTREPRALLAGEGYREMASAGQCCGSAGVYNLLRPDVAGELLRRKVEEVRGMGAGEVVTANPGCELQWRAGVRDAGLPVAVTHLVDHLYFARHPKEVAESAASAQAGAAPEGM